MNVINWEERHFQICLALLSRTDIGVRGVINDPKMQVIIKQADKMVELLKQHNQEASVESPANSAEKSVSPKKKRGGLWTSAIRQSEDFSKLWHALEDMGFDRGGDIPFQQFCACCEELNIELEEEEVEKFAEIYEVNIG